MKKQRVLGALLAGIMAVTGVPYIAQPLTTVAFADEIKHAAPTGLRTDYITSDYGKISWDEAEGVYGYRVYKYSSKSKGYIKYTDTKGPSCTLTGLSPKTKYKFRVAVLTISGNDISAHEMSDPLTVTTPGLAAPSNINVSITSTTATLKWNASNKATAYRIYIYSTKKGKFVKYKDVTTTTCTIDGLKEEKTYKIRIAALSKSGSRYIVNEKTPVISVTPMKSAPFTLPDYPTYGISGAEALRTMGATSYTISDYQDVGAIYVLGSGYEMFGGDYTGLMINKDDIYYGAVIMKSYAVSDSEIFAALKEKYGNPEIISVNDVDNYIWDSTSDIKIAMISAGTLIYAEFGYEYAPAEMISQIREQYIGKKHSDV